ncbi:hypothetical protein [Jannaschia ovalis]|uniref:HdeA/HdeB family protein n=1 Tax=Jannaschia ovalis TaxID=3038773 RepID=A0ABY8LCX0_9RHOB|nr:hypothetical protein [Jannaschia sp. GRR-S6-38]WGH78014.1 hypothetical protein P8627_13385 [Jannaschia sp. GRR-S6-38]
MGIVRTLLALLIAVPAGATSASAAAAPIGDPLPFFAACTGRLSAEMEFQWLTGDPDAARTEALRRAMIDILEALTPAEQAPGIMHRRVAAKAAHAALLATAVFGPDPRASEAAADRARELRDGCIGALLS